MDIKGPVDASAIEWIRMGTTVATNALLERKGERMALLITSGNNITMFCNSNSTHKFPFIFLIIVIIYIQQDFEIYYTLEIKPDQRFLTW